MADRVFFPLCQKSITGTNTKRRVGFNKMIKDALDGKINLINLKDNINSWDDSIWRIMVESAVVHRDASITFKFYNG